MAARRQNLMPMLAVGGAGVALFWAYRSGKLNALLPDAFDYNAPVPGTPITSTINYVQPSNQQAPYAPYAPVVAAPTNLNTTAPSNIVQTPYGQVLTLTSNTPGVDPNTPLGVCLARKGPNGWDRVKCETRLKAEETAYREAIAKAAQVGNINVSPDTSAADNAAAAEIAKYAAKIAEYTALIARNEANKLKDPSFDWDASAYDAAIAEFNQAISEIGARLESYKAQVSQNVLDAKGNAQQWLNAAAEHKANFLALTGFTLQ